MQICVKKLNKKKPQLLAIQSNNELSVKESYVKNLNIHFGKCLQCLMFNQVNKQWIRPFISHILSRLELIMELIVDYCQYGLVLWCVCVRCVRWRWSWRTSVNSAQWRWRHVRRWSWTWRSWRPPSTRPTRTVTRRSNSSRKCRFVFTTLPSSKLFLLFKQGKWNVHQSLNK